MDENTVNTKQFGIY